MTRRSFQEFICSGANAPQFTRLQVSRFSGVRFPNCEHFMNNLHFNLIVVLFWAPPDLWETRLRTVVSRFALSIKRQLLLRLGLKRCSASIRKYVHRMRGSPTCMMCKYVVVRVSLAVSRNLSENHVLQHVLEIRKTNSLQHPAP